MGWEAATLTALVVEKQKIRHNLALTRERAKGATLIGVLSADAFGLGFLEMAALMRAEGITRFAVDSPQDGLLLRRQGFTDVEILVLQATTDPQQIQMILEGSLVATVSTSETAQALSGLAERQKTVAVAEILLDTGSGHGFYPQEFDKINAVYQYCRGLGVSGVYTRLLPFSRKKALVTQLENFKAVLTRMRSTGLETGLIHAADSAVLFRHDVAKMDAVFVSLSPSGRLPGKTGLQKVGFVESVISEVHWLHKGASYGFAHAHKARRPMRVGVVPVGWADGFGRRDSLAERRKFRLRPRKLFVRAEDQRLPVLDEPDYTYTLVDLTDCSFGPGQRVWLDVSPLGAARLPKRYV